MAIPETVKDTVVNFPSRNYIYPEPYGVCLIIERGTIHYNSRYYQLLGLWLPEIHVSLNPSRGINTYRIIQNIIGKILTIIT